MTALKLLQNNNLRKYRSHKLLPECIISKIFFLLNIPLLLFKIGGVLYKYKFDWWNHSPSKSTLQKCSRLLYTTVEPDLYIKIFDIFKCWSSIFLLLFNKFVIFSSYLNYLIRRFMSPLFQYIMIQMNKKFAQFVSIVL